MRKSASSTSGIRVGGPPRSRRRHLSLRAAAARAVGHHGSAASLHFPPVSGTPPRKRASGPAALSLASILQKRMSGASAASAASSDSSDHGSPPQKRLSFRLGTVARTLAGGATTARKSSRLSGSKASLSGSVQSSLFGGKGLSAAAAPAKGLEEKKSSNMFSALVGLAKRDKDLADLANEEDDPNSMQPKKGISFLLRKFQAAAHKAAALQEFEERRAGTAGPLCSVWLLARNSTHAALHTHPTHRGSPHLPARGTRLPTCHAQAHH